MSVVWAAKERSEHFLQAGDQVVGFPIALQQGFDRLVLDADLSFEKFVLAFEEAVAIAYCAGTNFLRCGVPAASCAAPR